MSVYVCSIATCKHAIFRRNSETNNKREPICNGHLVPKDAVIGKQWLINCRYESPVNFFFLVKLDLDVPYVSFEIRRMLAESRLLEE